jgi:hypothetical protein
LVELRKSRRNLTSQNPIQEEIKSRLKSGNVCTSLGVESFVFQFYSKNRKMKIGKNIFLPVDLYGCESWSLTLREERRLRVLGNRLLRRIFAFKRDEVIGQWRKLHN